MAIVTAVLCCQVSVILDRIRAKQWKDLLVTSDVDAQMLSCYSVNEDSILRWAETMPIWYLQKYITNGLSVAFRNCLVVGA